METEIKLQKAMNNEPNISNEYKLGYKQGILDVLEVNETNFSRTSI